MLIHHDQLGCRPDLDGLFPNHSLTEVLELKREADRKGEHVLASQYFDFLTGTARSSFGLIPEEFDSIGELVSTMEAIDQENRFH